MFLVRARVHHCDSKHTSPSQHRRRDPTASGAIVSLPQLTVQTIERGVVTPRRSDPPEAEDVRLRHVDRLDVIAARDRVVEPARVTPHR